MKQYNPDACVKNLHCLLLEDDGYTKSNFFGLWQENYRPLGPELTETTHLCDLDKVLRAQTFLPIPGPQNCLGPNKNCQIDAKTVSHLKNICRLTCLARLMHLFQERELSALLVGGAGRCRSCSMCIPCRLQHFGMESLWVVHKLLTSLVCKVVLPCHPRSPDESRNWIPDEGSVRPTLYKRMTWVPFANWDAPGRTANTRSYKCQHMINERDMLWCMHCTVHVCLSALLWIFCVLSGWQGCGG